MEDSLSVGFDWCKRTKEWTVPRGGGGQLPVRSHGARAASEMSLSEMGWSFRKACILSQQLGDCF